MSAENQRPEHVARTASAFSPSGGQPLSPRRSPEQWSTDGEKRRTGRAQAGPGAKAACRYRPAPRGDSVGTQLHPASFAATATTDVVTSLRLPNFGDACRLQMRLSLAKSDREVMVRFATT